jgi:hypothetical protein
MLTDQLIALIMKLGEAGRPMRTLVKPGITLLTITALIALGRPPLSAQSVLSSRTLQKSYFSYGNSAATVPLVAGLQAVDSPVTVTCPTSTTSTTCTIEGEMRVQLGMSTFSGNFYSICLKVDGTIVEGGGCPSMGVIPQGAWTVTSFAEIKKVSAGTHKVQTMASTLYGGAQSGFYTNTYRIYKP